MRAVSQAIVRAVWWQVVGVVTLSLMAGCAPKSPPNWRPHSDLSSLPAKHQQQLTNYLEMYFGTASSPLFLKAPESGETPAGDKDGAATNPTLATHISSERLGRGGRIYQQQCAQCHGDSGDGQGQAAQYLDPPPRDYRRGIFKFTSTPFGSKPRREDLARTIRRGAKGTSMPAFRWMSEDDVNLVMDYVIMLSCRGEFEGRMLGLAKELEAGDDFDASEVGGFAKGVLASWDAASNQGVQPLTPMPKFAKTDFDTSARMFVELSCYKCHGIDGRGRPIGQNDAWGRPAKSANIAAGMLHGGRRSIDIYRRIYSGINGTPMPGFSEPGQGETREQHSDKIWQLVYFVTRVAEGERIRPELVADLQKLATELEAKAASGGATTASPSSGTTAPPSSGTTAPGQ